MCGIYGIVGDTTTTEVLNKLEKLEYRGYDSCGIAYISDNMSYLNKSVGNVRCLREKVADKNTKIAIGHTRWATHGNVSEANAHPHTTDLKRFFVCHNGMIDNYKALREEYNINLKTQTDTEIIGCLLDLFLLEDNDMIDVICKLRNKLIGTYAIIILDSNNPDILYFIKNKSPLLLGTNCNKVVLSSDQIAFDDETNVLILNDLNYGYINKNSYKIYSDNPENYNTFYKSCSNDISKASSHYMLDEIYYQDKMILDISYNYSKIDTTYFIELVSSSEEIVFVGAGSSNYASLILSDIYERKLNKRCFAVVASEILNFNIINDKTLFIFLTQSGETADLCYALDYLKNKYKIVSLCNNVNSTIGFNSDYVFPLFARKEMSVASTKAFTAMIYVGKLLLDKTIINNADNLYIQVKNTLKQYKLLEKISKDIINSNCVFYIGKNNDYYLALEGALKLREVSYLHSYSFQSGELKHGSIALIDNNSIAIGIVTDITRLPFVKNNLEEIKSRGGNVCLISNCYPESDIYIDGDEISIIIALQIISYQAALLLNKNIDQPRNLAKSVTVL